MSETRPEPGRVTREGAALAKVEPVSIDGADYYLFGEVCDALRIGSRDRAGRTVSPANKLRRYHFRRGYRSTVDLYLTRAGVRELVTRFGHSSCSDTMSCLRTTPPPDP